MHEKCRGTRVAASLLLGLVALLGPGCKSCQRCPEIRHADVPHEAAKINLPPYVIEAPDILLIDALRVVPLPPYRIEPLDALLVQVSNPLPTSPITGVYVVQPGGTINLGPDYGSVRVAGLGLDQALEVVRKHLELRINKPQVSVDLAQSRGMQQIRGDHLVRPDGTIGLGTYGSIPVSGLTLQEAKLAIEQHLSQYLLDPEVSVDVVGYNSKVYYVILDGGGYGQQTVRFPITGNETVLDALCQVAGLPAVASKHHIWVARRTGDPSGCGQKLDVDWRGITECCDASTNYQVLPGDRIYVKADGLVALNNWLSKVIAPMERVFGITLLGSGTIHSINMSNNTGGTGG